MAAVTSTLTALAIARPVHPFFQEPGSTGRVLASFDRSCYLETSEGRLVAVLAEPLGRGAFALTVGGSPSFADLHPETPVHVAARTMWLGDMQVGLATAVPWDPTLPALDGPADQGMETLQAFLRANAPTEGLARVLFDEDQTPLLSEARPAVRLLRAGLATGNVESVAHSVARLAGLGPGLTPSGDDVLAGILLAMRLWPRAADPLGPQVVSRSIIEMAAPRTGRISRAYLKAAYRGFASDAWHDLVRALHGDADHVILAAARILQTGETSGADMLAGFLLGGGWRPKVFPAPSPDR